MSGRKIDLEAPYPGQKGGIKLTVEGVELPEIHDVTMRFPVDELGRLEIGCLAFAPFKLTVPADVHIHLHLPQDNVLVEVKQGPEGATYTVESVPQATAIEELIQLVGSLDLFPDQAHDVKRAINKIRGVK